ncbi:TVP38/TMEM64 family protein [Exiguobacterium alkaliphilum]|uniref:TVP38/TMEM64 family protein n=1 Tax=Exiguobacterium alkaliphilum TaxID=1428684 RepID=UPI001BAD9062|nr:VTT domain-containing protein [Exiguobacterium alkaliphilum]QUE86460.1 TVP38/TMEM64 family protein [Exiguobacterium alkaliphilum]
MKKWKTQWIIASVLLIFGTATLLYQWIDLNPGVIRDYIIAFGWMAPVVFILLYTFRPLILFPASVLSIAGGLAFGTLPGMLYTIIGATLSALVAFYVATRFGERFLNHFESTDYKKLQQKIEEDGFFYVLNFDLVSYVSGLAKVKLPAFVLATVVGMIPGAFANNFLGSSIATGDFKMIVLALIVFAVLTLVATVFREPIKRKIHRYQKK